MACRDFAAVTGLLNCLDAELGGTLSAFEVMWQDFYELAAGDDAPLDPGLPYYVLVEALGSDEAVDEERFIKALAYRRTNRVM